jgi:hypothetical protein
MTSQVIPVLSSGLAPQQVVISRAVIDPKAVLKGGPYDNDNHFNCPPGVPLFTSEYGIESMKKSAGRGRVTGREYVMPVIFNVELPAGSNDDLIFVGVSYGAATRKQPIVAVATSGLVSIPHEFGQEKAQTGFNSNMKGWARSTNPYGSPDGPHIGVPTSEVDEDITISASRRIADYQIQRVSSRDFTVLLGTPDTPNLPTATADSSTDEFGGTDADGYQVVYPLTQTRSSVFGAEPAKRPAKDTGLGLKASMIDDDA